MSATRTADGREPSAPDVWTSRTRRVRGSRTAPRSRPATGRRGGTSSQAKPAEATPRATAGRPPVAAWLPRRSRQVRAPGGRPPRHRILLACTAALALGLVAVLLLNTVISQRAFQQHDLEIQLILLAEEEERLARAVQLAESPVEVERAARELGMVPAAAPVFLRLADGAILGEPVPAPAPTGPVSFDGAPGVQPTPTPSPDTSASGTPAPGATPSPGTTASPGMTPAPAATPSPGATSAPGVTPSPGGSVAGQAIDPPSPDGSGVAGVPASVAAAPGPGASQGVVTP